MKYILTGCLFLAFAATAIIAQTKGNDGDEKSSARPLAHMVFFEVQGDDPDSIEKLVVACQKYLTGHDGTIYFSVGARAKEMEREVNDLKFDVALHLVFESKAAHDQYAEHPRHLEFIRENSKLWSGVRVFDSYLAD